MRLLVLWIMFLAAPAMAQEVDSTHGHWKVFTANQGGKLCYIASIPTKETGNYRKRGNPYLLVTDRGANADEVSASSGYPYRKGSDVLATINRRSFKLFTQGELAWAYDAKQDAELIAAMKKGAAITVKGTSQRGTQSVDTYSLSGFTKAYERMNALCR